MTGAPTTPPSRTQQAKDKALGHLDTAVAELDRASGAAPANTIQTQAAEVRKSIHAVIGDLKNIEPPEMIVEAGNKRLKETFATKTGPEEMTAFQAVVRDVIDRIKSVQSNIHSMEALVPYNKGAAEGEAAGEPARKLISARHRLGEANKALNGITTRNPVTQTSELVINR